VKDILMNPVYDFGPVKDKVAAAQLEAAEAAAAINLLSPEERTPEKIAIAQHAQRRASELAIEANTRLIMIPNA
jgi:hypothetical protein